MAYPISEIARKLFEKDNRQVINITFQGTKETLNLSEKDILSGGFAIDRASVSGSKIEIGSVIASEVKLKLNNSDGKFDNVTFEGAEMYIQLGVKDWNDENSDLTLIPLGYFTIDEAPRILDEVTLSAFDRMLLFEKTVDINLLTFPTTISELLPRICNLCNVRLKTSVSDLPNKSYSISEAPTDKDLTYRQILSWIAEITGTCCFFDWDGELVLKWYTETTTEITANNRYSSDIDEKPITISGIRIKTSDEEVLIGADGYVINIESNSLIQENIRSVGQELYVRLAGFTYTPFSATIAPMPHLYPLDKITFVDSQGVSHASILTNVGFTINANTSIEAKGETETAQGYASANPLTKRESAIIAEIQKEQNKTLNQRVQTVLAFNELICNALGLYETDIKQTDGSVIRYLHNRPALEESDTIFTMTARGIAWTSSGWNNGEPVWSYGVTKAGDALFRLLSAEGINVSKAGEDYRIEITPSAFKIYYKEMLITSIARETMDIPRASFAEYSQWGKIRMVPYEDSGANLIFID